MASAVTCPRERTLECRPEAMALATGPGVTVEAAVAKAHHGPDRYVRNPIGMQLACSTAVSRLRRCRESYGSSSRADVEGGYTRGEHAGPSSTSRPGQRGPSMAWPSPGIAGCCQGTQRCQQVIDMS
eukprot:scaffold2088_cov399-Prasinococcus_capsulatus_cf.AAC.20